MKYQVMSHHSIGLGADQANINVYIANRPNIEPYHSLQEMLAMSKGEINYIGQRCGNGWRKVFNVYSKLLFALNQTQYNFRQLAPTWQQYRDEYLLQSDSNTALMFTPPIFSAAECINVENVNESIHIICGRTYAKNLIDTKKINVELRWLNEEFAINIKDKLVVCPYFDYRQLSNIKIDFLAQLIAEFTNKSNGNVRYL